VKTVKKVPVSIEISNFYESLLEDSRGSPQVTDKSKRLEILD
jgi:hypothetical protein